jgi:hypothetical protein
LTGKEWARWHDGAALAAGGSTIGLSATDARRFVIVFSAGDGTTMRFIRTNSELIREPGAPP